MRKIAVVGLVTLLVGGCASKPPRTAGGFREAQVVEGGPLTPIGKPLRREVGETIYEHGFEALERRQWARLMAQAVGEMEVGHAMNVPAGASGPLWFRTTNGAPVMCFKTSGAGTVAMAVTGGGQVIGCLVDTDRDGRFDVSMFAQYERYFPLAAKVPYEVHRTEDKVVEVRGAVKRDLLYQGLAGGSVRLSYREFTADGMARPAFTQELTYAIGPDGTAEIGFRGLRARITAASNAGIEYVVERGMER